MMLCRAPRTNAPNDALQMAWRGKMAGNGKLGKRHMTKNAKRKVRPARAVAKPKIPRKARAQRVKISK